MAAIISTNTLGLSNAAIDKLGLQGGNPSIGSGGEAVYVNAATGNLVVQRQDELLAARGPDISVLRTYNSQGQMDGDNNDNWRIGFYRQLGSLTGAIGATGSTIIRTREDGAAQNFTWNGSAYVSTDGEGAHDTLSYNSASGQWAWTDGSSNATEVYDWANGSGKLLKQSDSAGNSITYTYNPAGLLSRATSANSSATQFNYTDLTYDASANLQSVTNSAWDDASASNKTISRVAYAYEAWSGGNRLKTVTVDLTPDVTTDSKTYVTSYTYASSTSTLLSGLVQSDGTSLAFTYTADGKIASIRDALGQTTTYAYDTVNARTSVTDALGNVTVYGYDAAGRLASITAPAVGGVSATSTYSWDASGNLTGITDGEGKSSVMQYDANGNLLLQRDAAGNTVTRSYDANNQLLTQTVYLTPDPDGGGAASASTPLTTRYVYDAAGKSQLRFIVSAEGRVTEYDYDASGQRTSTIQYRGNAYTGASFGESDLLSWIAGADKTRSVRIDYAYDFRGQLASSTTWGSVDASGNGVAGTGAATSFVYSPNGQLLKTIGALGAVLQTTTTTYDGLGRQLSYTNVLNQTTSSVYDDAGHQTTITAANGLTVVNTWDNAGRLIGTQQSGSGVGAQTGYFYDADNQLRMTRDALGNTNWMLYDAAGRKVGDIDGNGSLTEYVYDGNNRVVERIRYATAVNTALLSFNADGSPSAAALALTLTNLRPAPSADQTTWNVYDDAGRLIKSVDASGAVTENVYDGASRLIRTIAYANTIATTGLGTHPGSAQVAPTANSAKDRVTAYYYDGDGQLRMTRNADGVASWTLYDAAGSKVGEVDGNGSLTEYVRDGNNRVVKTIRYATAINTAQFTPNADGSPTGAALGLTLATLRPTSGANQATWNVYDVAGNLVKTVDASGTVVEKAYDGAGRLVQTTAYANTISTAALPAQATSAQIAPTADAANDRISRKLFDANGLRQATLDAEGYLSETLFNSAGRAWKRIAYATATASAQRASGTLDALRPAANAADQVSYTLYDAKGAVVGEIDAEGYLTETTRDADGNATQAKRYASAIDAAKLNAITADTQLATLRPAANAQDRVQTFSYDALNRLVASTNGDGTLTTYAYDAANNLGSSTAAALTTEARTTSASFDAFGHVISSTDGRGKTTTYQYDALGQLASSTDALGNRTLRYYNEDGLEVASINALGEVTRTTWNGLQQKVAVTEYGTRIGTTTLAGLTGGLLDATAKSTLDALANASIDGTTTYAYNVDGTLASATDAVGNVVLYGYNSFDEQTSVLVPVSGGNAVTGFGYDRRGLRITQTTDPNAGSYTGLNLIASTQYDAFSRVAKSTDARGGVVQFAYDRLGRQVQIIDAGNGTSSTVYDAYNRVLSKTDALGHTTTTSYNAAARSMTVTTAEGISVTTVRNRHGQVCSITDGLGNTSIYNYDAAGNLTGVTKPINGTSSASTGVSYTDNGLVLARTDAAGIVTAYTYDAAGRVLTRTVDADRAGYTGLKLTTSYSYDARGRTLLTTDPRGVVTKSQYDRKGQLISETVDPTTIVSANDNPTGLNLVTQFSYDGSGRQVSMTDPSGTVTSYSYDKAGRRITEQLDPNGLNLTTQYGYDGNDNLVSITDAAGNIARNVYDAKNQLIYSVDGANAVTRYDYDAKGNVIRKTRYATALAADAAPDAVQTSASDQITRNAYDNDNRLIYSVDGIGAVTRYEYDANGNVIRQTRYATAIAAGAAPNTVQSSANDQITRNLYDGLNRLVYSADATGAVTRYDYDANGNIAQRTEYATTIAAGAAPDTVQSASGDRVSRNVYDAANRVSFSVDASGAVTRYFYDGKGNIVQRTEYANTIAAGVTPDTVQASANDRVTRNVYDAANRLCYSADPVGAVTRYEYDVDGNMIRRTAFAATIAAGADPRSVTSTFGADQITTNAYDNANRLTRRVDGMGAITDFSYDANGKLIGTTSYAQAVNLASTGIATQSSTPDTTSPASLAIDGSTTSSGSKGLATTGSEANAWWQVDLRRSQGISTIDIYNRTDSLSAQLSDFYVFVSDTDLTGRSYASIIADQTVKSFFFAGEAPSRLTIAASTSGRYVRVQLSGTNALSLAEVRVNGYTPQASASADHTVNYEYDAAGRQTKALYPNTATYSSETATQLATNGANGVAARVETIGTAYTQSWYDAFGKLVAVRDAAGNMRYQAWDAAGHLLYEVDAAGYVIGRQYDALGNVVAITRYADKIADATRSAWGTSAPSAATIASLLNNASNANRITTMQYDKAGRVVLEVRPAVYAYDLVNGVMSGATASPTTRSTYDAFGKLIRKEEQDLDGSWTSTWFYYDGNGRQTASVDALGYLSIRVYDAFGNVTQVTEYANAASGVGASGYTAPAASTQDRTTRYTWDGDNRKLSETRVGVEYMADTSQTGVTFYRDANFAGPSQALGAGWYHPSAFDYAFSLFSTSSVKVAPGWKLTAYAANDYTEKWIDISADNADLTGAGFNDQIKSFVILQSTTVGDLTTSYAYDAFGNQISATDANNNSSATWYDQANRIRAVADPSRQGTTDGSTLTGLTQYVRDAFGNVIEQTDRASGANTANASGFTFSSSTNDRVSSSKYDNRGRKIESTDALGHKQYFSYDANGNVAKMWQGVSGNDGITHTVYTETTYDARNQAVYLNDSGKEIQLAYDAFGELIARGGKAGNSTSLGWQETFNYDNGGRLWRSNAKDGVNKVMLYDLQNNFTAEIRSDSVDLSTRADAASVNGLAGTRRVISRFDALGRITQEDLANGASVYQTWDRWGNRLSVSDARNASWLTTYAYNSNNQVTKETLPSVSVLASDLVTIANQNPVTEYFYDYAGNLVAQRDARAGVTRKSWDAAGNLLAEYDAAGNVVRHYYDGFNQEVQRIDALNNATGYAYDNMGRLTTVTRAAAQFYGIDTTSYDAKANESISPITLYDNTGASGATSYFGAGTYNNLSKTFNSIKVIAGWKVDLYGDNGQIKTYTSAITTDLPSNMKGHVIKLTVTHQGGREAIVQQVQSGVSQLSYTYDELGRRIVSTDARGSAGATYYTYDLAGRVTTVRQPGAGANSTTYQYDAAGYKSVEKDAMGNVTSWTNDYFGRAQSHVTLDGKTTTYTYDAAGQLKTEVSTGGRNVTNTYNTAGQITRIVDKLSATSTRTTDYTYDLAGNHTRDSTNIDTGTYQTETLSYDALGRLTDSTDSYGSTYARVEYIYDALGNRMRQKAMVNMTQMSATGATVKTAYFAYDALNRVRLFNGGVDNSLYNTSNLSSTTGRRVTYDANGNRIKEEDGVATQIYVYDALNRLTTVTQGGNTKRAIKYDLADRVLEAFDNTQTSETAAVHYTNLYDAQGHMLRQWHRAGSTAASDGSISTTSSWDDSTSYYDYDNLGNIIRTYTQRFGDHLFHTAYATTFTKIADRYLRSQISGKRTDNLGNPGYSDFTYDFNGYLTNFADSDASSNNRSYQSNVSGQILRKSGSSGTTKIMMANGQELGSYNTSGLIDFNVAYQAIDSIHPATGPGSYEVNAGDTLQSIAFSAYGDRTMWYLIADANGLSSDATLTPGMSLKLPSVLGSTHDNFQTFKPVDTASIIGVTDPTITTPTSSSNTCKTVGIIIAAVVASIVITALAVAATTFTLGLAGAPMGLLATVAISAVWAAVGGAAASIVSQEIMIAGGLQQSMDWKDVAYGAISGAVTAGASAMLGSALRTAVKSARMARMIAAAKRNGDLAAQDAALAAKAPGFVTNKITTMLAKGFGGSDDVGDAAGRLSSGTAKKFLFSYRTKAGSKGKILMHGMEALENMATDALSQGIGIAAGTRDKFDWNEVWQSSVLPGNARPTKLGPMKDAEAIMLHDLDRELVNGTKAGWLDAIPFGSLFQRKSYNAAHVNVKKMDGGDAAIARDKPPVDAEASPIRAEDAPAPIAPDKEVAPQPNAGDEVADDAPKKPGLFKKVMNAYKKVTATRGGDVLVKGFVYGFAGGFAANLAGNLATGGNGDDSESIWTKALMAGTAASFADGLVKMPASGIAKSERFTKAARTDNARYDAISVAATVAANVMTTWAFYGLDSDKSMESYDALQARGIMDANKLGYMRIGRNRA